MYTVPLLLAAALPSAEVAPQPRSGEVTVAEVRTAIKRGLPFVEKSSNAWRSERKCVSCHQVPFAVWALTEGKARGFKVDTKKADDLTAWAFDWCFTDAPKGEKTGGHHLTSVFMILSQAGVTAPDDAVKTYPLFESFFAKRQRPEGSWREGRQIRINGAQREADDADTMWTLLAIKSLERLGDKLSAETRKGLVSERDKALKFLKDSKPEKRIDWLALRTLVAKEHETPERAKEFLRELLAQQNADGGWGYVRGGESYAHTTGEVLYCLGSMGLGESDAAVKKAWKYLVRSQQQEGWWYCKTRELFSTKPDTVRDTSIHWGTAWATIGLMQTLPKK